MSNMTSNAPIVRGARNLAGGVAAPKSMLAQPAMGDSRRVALGNIVNTRTNAGFRSAFTKPTLLKSHQSNLENVVPVAHAPVPMETVVQSPERAMDVEMEELPESNVAKSVAFSSHVENIDADDEGNPQLLAEYVNDIYGYLRKLETTQEITQGYLEKSHSAITPKMRSVLLDWLVEVSQQFNLLQETLFMAVALFDRFMSKFAGSVSKKTLQLVGIGALFVASKYEEMYAPSIEDFVYISDKAFTASQIRMMEVEYLRVLNFDLGRPLPLHFLRRASKAAQVDGTVHNLAKYVMELSIIEYKLAHVRPSIIAAASLAFAMCVLDCSQRPVRLLWTPTLVHYTGYHVEHLADTLQLLADNVRKIVAEDAADKLSPSGSKKKLRAITKKYTARKTMRIATIPELSDSVVTMLARGDL